MVSNANGADLRPPPLLVPPACACFNDVSTMSAGKKGRATNEQDSQDTEGRAIARALKQHPRISRGTDGDLRRTKSEVSMHHTNRHDGGRRTTRFGP